MASGGLLSRLFLLLSLSASAALASVYSSINGLLCIRPPFVESADYTDGSIAECAVLCTGGLNCQAFATPNASCLLFVFDKCSKYVRDCNCTTMGQVFVKKQTALPWGALCPPGYAGDYCGSKYKLFSGSYWNSVKPLIDSEPGLVIMADVVDKAEFNYMASLQKKYSWFVIMLGGQQLPNSDEPSGGWYWVDCNITISSGVWNSGEPNNQGGNEYIAASSVTFVNSGIYDTTERKLITGGLAECQSPFE